MNSEPIFMVHFLKQIQQYQNVWEVIIYCNRLQQNGNKYLVLQFVGSKTKFTDILREKQQRKN